VAVLVRSGGSRSNRPIKRERTQGARGNNGKSSFLVLAYILRMFYRHNHPMELILSNQITAGYKRDNKAKPGEEEVKTLKLK
jgi:hypothetical protein